MIPGLPYDAAHLRHDPSARARDNGLAVLRPLQPLRAEGVEKRRIGRANDGGYVMLDDFAAVTDAYSLGISDDVSWDLELAERDIDVFQYDHTIDALPCAHPRFHWVHKGIASARDADHITLADAILENGHADKQSMILKCDIECFEWHMLAYADRDALKPFRQVVIELHAMALLNHEPFALMARKAVDTLTAHHCVVHVHGNNCAPLTRVGGLTVPMVIELTLANRHAYTLTETDETFPSEIDMPNSTALADFPLGHFRF